MNSTIAKLQFLAAVRGFELALYAGAIAFLTHGVVCGVAIAVAATWLAQATVETIAAFKAAER